MVDPLLPYYNRELAYLRKLGAEFAEAHPKIAGRLRLSSDAIEDPHVSRLIEAVAFLNARVRYKLEDEFPELTDALLNVLYPHYLAPVPSMAVVQFRGQPDLTSGYTVPAGAELESEPVAGEECRFRTCYPATLWPIALEAAALTGRPLVAPANPRAGGAVASLRLTLKCLSDDTTFSKLGPDRLRFFLRGQPQEVFPLYELIFNNTVSVALADSAVDAGAVVLPADCIRPVGFGPDEGMVPYPPRSFAGYRLLTEYFTFPEKFLFFDIVGLERKTLLEAGRTLEVFLYLNRTSADLERSVGAETFALGCAPIVNLFRQRAEPILLTRTINEYRVVPDARRPLATEVYSVDRVKATAPDGKEVDYLPFYSVKHASAGRDQATFWHPVRRSAGPSDSGSEVFLDFVDLGFDPSVAADWTVSAETTCLNRDLPSRLPYGGGHPHLRLVEGASPVVAIHCLTPPTPTLRQSARKDGYWRLISHLSLNHLSLADMADGAEPLREILKLYDFRDSAETRAVIDALLNVEAKRAAARVPTDGAAAFCRGMDVTVTFKEEGFSGSGLFLLASVLERFLGLYATINSFTRLTVRVKGRTGVLRRWPPRAGDRVLL
jgi:type VI secretion system protein ImpG